MKPIVAVAVLAAGLAASAAEKLAAFPGAEGFGMYARGGRGGKVLLVTNLGDYVPGREKAIPGSLRAACEAKGPRIVAFRVSGTIPLKGTLSIREPFLTLAGQSAPGGGICLKNHQTVVQTHDVVIRHLRFRPGDEPAAEFRKRGRGFAPDALSIAGSSRQPVRDIILDHCSTSWAIDEVLSVSGAGITNVTVQWCIISESLNRSSHQKGAHGYGSLLRCNGNVTFHHNIYAHHRSRSPRPGTYGEGSILLDFRNNLVYNSVGYSAADPVRMNYVGNYIKRPTRRHAFSIGGPATRMYVHANFMAGAGERNKDDWRLIAGAKPHNRMTEPFPVAAVATDSAAKAYERLLASCGATLPARDAVDARIAEEIKTGKGRIINSQKDVGGWPELESTPAPKDADRDGMPDAWETTHGLDPSDPSDAARDTDGDGYTNIEEWLNGTDPGKRIARSTPCRTRDIGHLVRDTLRCVGFAPAVTTSGNLARPPGGGSAEGSRPDPAQWGAARPWRPV